MSKSDAQRAENESTFRRANEHIERKAKQLHFDERRTPYLCECDDLGCTEVLMLTRSEYEGVRSHPRHFFILPGHGGPNDRTLEQNDAFRVIEKTGEEGRIVEQQDPRTAA